MGKGREKPPRCGGGAGQSGWFGATVRLVFQETGSAGVGVLLFSRSSSRFPPKLQPLQRFSRASLSPGPPFLHRCPHSLTALPSSHCPDQKLGGGKLYPQNPPSSHAVCSVLEISPARTRRASAAELRLGRPWVSGRDHALPCPAQLGRRKPPLVGFPPATAPTASLHSGGAKGMLILSPHPPAEPPPKKDLSCAGFKRRLGDERAQPKDAQKCRLWGALAQLPGVPRLCGGGIWAAHTNSLPRRVSRTQAEPALAFPPPKRLPGPDGPPGSAG